MHPHRWDLVVASGGPACFMAVITAAEADLPSVFVLEATCQPLGKALNQRRWTLQHHPRLA